MVNADKAYPRLCLSNPVDNALKYSGSPVIEINTDISGQPFVATIKTNGIGHRSGHQRKIFDRFTASPGELHTTKDLGLASILLRGD